MPILLWVIYPLAIWSACAGMISDDGKAGPEKEFRTRGKATAETGI